MTLAAIHSIFDDHQRRAIALLGAVLSQVEAGMSTSDVAALAQDRLRAYDFDTWFHRPTVRFGGKRRRARLEVGDLLQIDLAPGTRHAFGDIGATRCFGTDDTELVGKAREVCRATCGYASHWKTVGELFIFAEAWANNRQVRLATRGGVGHDCLPPEGLVSRGYPRSAHLATRLRRHQIQRLNPRRCRGAYAVRVPLTDGEHTAVFEEMIFIDDESRTVLGRGDLSDIGDYAE